MTYQPYNYPAKSLDIQSRLMMLGLKPNHLMLIGSFIVAYGMFETTLERALWTFVSSGCNLIQAAIEN
jgi:hypothetical protein